MPQIFISYSRTERPTAASLAERLTEAGYDVWWDAALVGGQHFESEIQAALQQAAAVLVLWSRASTTSDWVRAEAEVARQARTAVPLLIDDVPLEALPLVYRALHAIDLRNWTGDISAPGYRQVLDAVAKLSAAPARTTPPSSHGPLVTEPAPPRPKRRLPLLLAGLAVLVLLAAGAAWWQFRPQPAADVCAGKPRFTLSEVPLSLCLGADWVPPPIGADSYTGYTSADGSVMLNILPQGEVFDLAAFRKGILDTAVKIAGDPSYIEVVRDGEQEIGGKPWKLVRFTNQGQADFLTYYYSAPGFGAIQVVFTTSVGGTARRDQLAAPVLDSIRFTK